MAACFVTNDQCKSWEKTGKQEFLKFCRSVGDKTGSSCIGNRDFRQAVYEVCFHAVKGNLRQEQALSAVTELNDKYQDVISLITDVLALIDIDLSLADDDKGQRDRYTSFVGAFSQLTSSETVFKSRLDLDSLETAGILPSKTLFQQKYVKIRTRLYYKQQKFNLLREESEGYSKLITELNQDVSDNKLTPEQVLQNIKSLIGCFNLDPNRVIDVLLESFENHPDQEAFYVPLVRSYVRDKETLCHVLGFKFQFCKEEETPASLYKLAALLLKNDLIELDGLCPHLSPSDQSVIDYSKKEMADAKAYARKLMVVNLSDKASEDKKAAEDQVKIDPHTNNQKLGLVEALLGIGAWEKAKSILDRLPEFYGTTYKPVATSLCALIHTVLDPVYRRYSGMSSRISKMKNKHEMPGCNIQKAATFKEVYTLVFPMVTYLGPYAACDPILVVKLIRLGKTYMSKRNQGSVAMDDNIFYYGLLSILDEVVIPSLSFQSCNCCVSEELWQLLKLFPYELRYRMYGNWKNEMYSQHPRLMRLRADCLERAKYIMKRLSKENVKPSGRQLGKLSHSNPSVLFEYVLTQIQKYDNLIGPVVDSLKYLTSLSYDVLIFCIIEGIANPEKEKTKYDDTTLSLWLQSLATFAGSICKKYPVDLAGLMQYVTNQLKAGKSIDLILMREIVQKMAGIEISEEITNDQLDAMSGGELLKQEGGYFSQVRNTKKSSTRLKDTVLEHDLALSLCLLISQQRDAVIYKEGMAQHLKLIGKLYDQCQDTLVQFGSFLSLQLSTEEFVKRLPPIDVMVGEYHIRPNSAFFLSRSLYSYELNAKYEELRKAEKAEKDKDKDKDRTKSSTAMRTQKYIEATEIVMNPVIECVKPLQSPKIWEDLSPNFYVTFWSLSVYDISVPTGSYQKQIRSLENIISAIDDTKETPQSKKKKEKDRCNQLIEKLKDEEKKQSDHVGRVIARLRNDKEKWFVAKTTKNEAITQFLQLCIFPRCCFTASDANFCAKFLHILHNLKTSSFSTLICYDRIFCDITYTVSSCTENEAHRYGRFLCAALETVMKWHSAKHIYEKECANYPGFVTVFRKGEVGNNIADQLDFENYRHVCHKWHFRITKAMVSCIESGNYIQIRNALIILTKVLTQYPRIIQFGQALERRIDRLRSEEKDKRHDIYALAMGYGGMLKSKKGYWVPEAEFHLKDKDGKAKVTPHGVAAKTDAATGSREPKTTATKSTSAEKAASAAKEKEKDGLKLRIKTPSSEPKEQKGEERHRIKVIGSGEVKRSSEEKVKVKIVTPSETKKSTSDSADKKESSSSAKSSSRDKERKEKSEKTGETSVEASKSREKVREEKAVKEERSVRREEKEKSRESLGKEKASTSREGKDDRVLKERKEEKSRELKVKDDSHHEVKVKEEKIRIHRDGKLAEKREKEEKHERIKLKRSYSPEREDSELRRERDHYREEREEARAGSATSNSSSHRSYPQDESPRHLEERDSKRRKTEMTPSTSKDDAGASSKSRHRRSLSPDKERDRERKDKKRVKREAKENISDNDNMAHGDQEDYHEVNDSTSSGKKRKEILSGGRSGSKLNGESVEREVKKERHHDNGYPKASSSRNDVMEHTPEDGHSRSKSSKDSEKKRSSSKRPKPS